MQAPDVGSSYFKVPNVSADSSEKSYAQAWALVHFLRHGDPAWAEREFPRFMLYVAEGYPVQQSLTEVYGFTPTTVEDRFRDYVKQF